MAISKRKFKSRDVKLKGYYPIIAFLLLVLIDRFSKIWATNLKGNVDHGIFAFTYVMNTGAGFSILQNMNTLLAILSVIVAVIIIYYHKHIPLFSFILILAGITGNLLDRIAYGGVIDFINLKFWPIFNVADSLIFIGVAYWVIRILRSENHKDSGR